MNLIKKYPSTFMSILIIVGAVFVSNSVLAGVEVGNGGDAIVCRDKQGKIKGRPELLDYYEARVNFGWKIKESGTREQILNRFLERIESINSYNKTEYRERANQFFSEANLLNDIELVDIPDSNHTTLPRDCKVEQLVIQKTTLLPE